MDWGEILPLAKGEKKRKEKGRGGKLRIQKRVQHSRTVPYGKPLIHAPTHFPPDVDEDEQEARMLARAVGVGEVGTVFPKEVFPQLLDFLLPVGSPLRRGLGQGAACILSFTCRRQEGRDEPRKRRGKRRGKQPRKERG